MENVKNRSPPLDISVLISGAGVGGIMAALELCRAGCSVRMFERSPHNITTGDSFTIGPSALDAFRNWPNLERRNKEIAYLPKVAYHRPTGERIAGPFEMSSITPGLTDEEKKSKIMWRHMRPTFHAMLLEQLREIGVEVEYGKEVVKYFEDEASGKAGVVVKGGERLTADLVVAADGVRGASWELVAGEPVPARSSGTSVFRASFPVERVLDDPEIVDRFKFDEDGNSIMELWSGPKMQTSFWRNERSMSWAIVHEDHGDSSEESWSHRVSPDAVFKLTSQIPSWPSVANRVIAATPADRLIDWKLMWRDPQPKWTSPSGHVVQLGDAAHTFLPSSGNGATQAIEDAISLAACVRLAGTASSIPDATRAHNLLRFERVSCLQALGVVNAENRDSSRKGKDTDKSMQVRFGRWIVGHDPETYAVENYARAVEWLRAGGKAQGGEGFKNSNVPKGMEYRAWTIDGLRESVEKGEKTVLDGDWN